MDNLNLLADEDVSQDRDVGYHCWEDALIVECLDREVVDFQAVGHITNSFSIAVGMSHDYHFVTEVQETL